MTPPDALPPLAPSADLVAPSSRAHLTVRVVLLVAVLAAVASALLRATPDGVPLTGRLDAADAAVALAVLVVMLAMIVGGPDPRLATRWAWFWLVAYAWPAALTYLLLEPTAAWRRDPVAAPRRRLTGGWGFLLGVLLGTPLLALVTGL